MKWIALNNESQLQEIVQKSFAFPQVIFKYSSRCSLNDLIRDRLEQIPGTAKMDFYFLDLIAYRSLSDRISREFGIHHESPQVLVIRHGDCVYDESHTAIRMDDILAA